MDIPFFNHVFNSQGNGPNMSKLKLLFGNCFLHSFLLIAWWRQAAESELLHNGTEESHKVYDNTRLKCSSV